MLDKFSRVLARLCREDPTVRVSYDDQSGQTILSGMGELHLEVYCDLLREQHGIGRYRSPPLVTYRETIVAVLEPVMTVEVDAPAEFVDAVQSGLVRRRGQITDSEVGLNAVRIWARVPLAEMFGDAGDLRGTTEGKGEYSMEFADFQRVPASVQDHLVARHRGQ